VVVVMNERMIISRPRSAELRIRMWNFGFSFGFGFGICFPFFFFFLLCVSVSVCLGHWGFCGAEDTPPAFTPLFPPTHPIPSHPIAPLSLPCPALPHAVNRKSCLCHTRLLLFDLFCLFASCFSCLSITFVFSFVVYIHTSFS
jgi:hypothetical protein